MDQIEAELAARKLLRRRRRTIVGVGLLLAITGALIFRSLVREAKAGQMLARARASERAEKYLIAERHLGRLLERYPGTRAARDGEALLEELQPEIGTQWLFVEAEAAEKAKDYAKAIEVYERVGEEYPKTRLLDEARERLMDARRQGAAQELFEHARSLERDCEFADAAKAYEDIVGKFPNTAGGKQAQERVLGCRQAAPLFQEAYEAARRGMFDAALARLDALLDAGLEYHGVFGGKALVYEAQRDWQTAAEMWDLAQRASYTEEGARHLRLCLGNAGRPVILLGVRSAQEVGSGMMVVSGEVVNNLAGPVKNVKIEVSVFAEATPAAGAAPLLKRVHVMAGPIASGQSRPFRLRMQAPSEARTLEPKVAGYEET
jgi:outer membrane protein assembly factor BamD (BamD/ComL family)